jgi:hypothetical protein
LQCEVIFEGQSLEFGHDLKFWFFDNFGESAPKEDIYSCLLYKSKQNTFNPVQRYLEQVYEKPERVSIKDIATRYFGTTDPIYDRMVEMWLISAVARVYSPGAQVDHTLILQSGQGKYKSTFFSTLGGEFFSDSVKDIENKDSLLTLHSSWIVELAEINRITSKKQAAIVKHFLTQREDTFRKPYAKEVQRNPRRSVFCGTVNPSRFLVDDENRRFWIIPIADHVSAIDIPQLEKERDGIWASAVDALLGGMPWYPTKEEKQAIAELSKDFMDVDVWADSVAEFIAHRNYVSVYEILLDLLQIEPSNMDRRSEMRVAKILDNLGWTKQIRKTVMGKVRRVRVNPTNTNEDLNSTLHNHNTNPLLIQVGKVGNDGKTADLTGIEVYQPTDQPPDKVGIVQGRIDQPTLVEVGSNETQTQQGFYQPTDQPNLLPKKYVDAGFVYRPGDKCRIKGSSLEVTILELPSPGIYFGSRSYLCEYPNGADDWIPQAQLIPVTFD